MSKRVKTFEEKQRPLTPSERAALQAIHDQSSGKKLKNQVLTPDELKLLDVVDYEAEKKENSKDVGKIITPEDLKKEEQTAEEKRINDTKEFEKSFNKQLKDWSKVKTDGNDYKNFDFDGDYYLVRVFSMDVSQFSDYKTLEYEWSRVLKQWKLTDKQLKNNTFPIVKILKVARGFGKDNPNKYNEGDVCIVPGDDIVGDDWNPKFLHVMQFQNSQNMTPVLPDGMSQRIPKIQITWNKYLFVRPWKIEPEYEDRLTYLIPSTLIKGEYKL